MKTLTVQELAASVIFSPNGLIWKFENSKLARYHLRQYESLLSHWGYQCQAKEVIVRSSDGGEWTISPREHIQFNIKTEVNPMTAFNPIQDDPTYLLVAEQRLTPPLVAALLDLQQNPGIKAIVNWQTQKQVILTQDCNQIPIGNDLEDCLNYSRHQYWLSADLERFMQQCQQELRQDGSNTLEFKYLTFDPTTGGDWIQIVGRYKMIDAGRLGIYQLGENLSFESVGAPVS
jgi:hypothetical protein